MIIALVLFLVLISGLGWYALKHVLPYSAVRPYRVSKNDIASRFATNDPAVLYGFVPQHFDIQTRDSLSLDAWFVPADSAKGTVLIMHGIASSKEMMSSRIAKYHALGYNVVAYDSRAHGGSGGLNCTLGYNEKYDVVDCFNTIEQRFHTQAPYIIHGASMGGAISLQAMAIEPRIGCGVVMCAFANLKETLLDYMQQMFYLRSEWLGDIIFRESERIAAFKIEEVRPEFSARNILQPVLIVHGDEDEKISVEYGRRNFASLASRSKELFIVHGGGHFNLSEIGGDTLEQRIRTWVAEHGQLKH